MNSHTAIVAVLVLQACAGVPPGSMPIPAVTPFDDSPVARSEYLEHFRAGYEAALTGNHYTRCPRHHDEVSRARSSGWSDGQNEGFGVWFEEMTIADRASAPLSPRSLVPPGSRATCRSIASRNGNAPDCRRCR